MVGFYNEYIAVALTACYAEFKSSESVASSSKTNLIINRISITRTQNSSSASLYYSRLTFDYPNWLIIKPNSSVCFPEGQSYHINSTVCSKFCKRVDRIQRTND